MNVPTLVDRAVAQFRDRVAIECEGRRRTFGDVGVQSNRFARYLTGLGVGEGARVAVILPNCLEFAEIDFGIAKTAAASVQLSPRLTATEIQRILRDADVSAVVFSVDGLEAIDTARSELQDKAPANFICVGGSTGWAVDYDAAIAAAGTAAGIPTPWDERQPYRLAYTSGTTGTPKGVILSTGSIIGVTRNILTEFRPSRPADRLLHLAPLCHGTGMFVLPWFIVGGTSVIHAKFDPERTLDSLAAEQVDSIKLVPTMIVAMLECGDAHFAKLHGAEQVIYGGSPMPIEPMKRALSIAGPVFCQLFGQSEAPMTITVLPKEDHTVEDNNGLLASAGRPWTCVDVGVIGKDGSPLATGVSGEVVVNGDHVMDGYWRNPQATAETLVDGWVRTRDIGRFDDRGYLYLLDRKNDMIISGGMNVYPREVEDVLHRHQNVFEAAVISRPDEKWGEAIVAVVAAKHGSINPEELRTFCRDQLAGYKVPKEVLVVEAIPKNAVGKISRKLVKDQLNAHELVAQHE